MVSLFGSSGVIPPAELETHCTIATIPRTRSVMGPLACGVNPLHGGRGWWHSGICKAATRRLNPATGRCERDVAGSLRGRVTVCIEGCCGRCCCGALPPPPPQVWRAMSTPLFEPQLRAVKRASVHLTMRLSSLCEILANKQKKLSGVLRCLVRDS